MIIIPPIVTKDIAGSMNKFVIGATSEIFPNPRSTTGKVNRIAAKVVAAFSRKKSGSIFNIFFLTEELQL